MAIIPEHYFKSVLAIGIRNGETINWIGTGFFCMKHMQDDQYRPFLVTNRHIVLNKNSLVIRLKKKNSDELCIVDVALWENGAPLYKVSKYWYL